MSDDTKGSLNPNPSSGKEFGGEPEASVPTKGGAEKPGQDDQKNNPNNK